MKSLTGSLYLLPQAGTQGLLKTQAIMLSCLQYAAEESYIIPLIHKISTFHSYLLRTIDFYSLGNIYPNLK